MKDPKKSISDGFYFLDPAHTDPARVRRERDKAKKLRVSGWWKQKIQKGICHYCERKFEPRELTMDHIVPIARGGTSTQGNVVPACRSCNASKKLETPAERLLKQLANEKPRNATSSGGGDATENGDEDPGRDDPKSDEP